MAEENSYIEEITKKNSTIKGKSKIFAITVAVVAISFSVFHVYTAGFGTLPSWQHRAVHVSFGLILLFLLFPFSKRKGFRFYDIIPVILSSLVLMFTIIQYPEIEYRAGSPNGLDLVVGTLLIILIAEAVRRTNGILMTLIILIFFGYIFLGPYLPNLFGHPGYSYSKTIDTLFLSTSGIFSDPIYTSSTVIVLFIIFGSFFLKSGAGQFFINLAFVLVGKLRGGPALAATGSSAMLGTITGNGAANVAITGAFTIPMMKRIGYPPKFAAAAESVASQGGQLMPPIMGASVFIMAELIGVPYINLIKYALIPAILYFVTAGILVYVEARKLGLKGLSSSEIPKKSLVIKQIYFFIPIISIIWLLVLGYSPSKAGLITILVTLVLSYVSKSTWMNWRDILASLEDGARSSMIVVAACAGAGIIVGTINLTGIGVRFSRIAIQLAGDNMILLLMMIMIASLILGMGMPTVSAYVILAVLAAPALVEIGIPVVASHLFVFYFGVISGLTPPVAVTAYTAAGLANSNPNATALTATKIGIGGFVVPYMFIYNPYLLLQGGDVLNIALALITTIIGIVAFVFAIQGYALRKANYGERIIFFTSSLLLVYPGIITDTLGIIGVIIGLLFQFSGCRKVAL